MSDSVALHGQETIAKGSKSFALASRIFSPGMRDDAAMLYAWCRYCDDVIDGQVMGHGQIEGYKDGQSDRLAYLDAQTRSALAGEPQSDPVFEGLARVFKTHDIPHKHAYELLRGFEMDAEQRVYRTTDDIVEYCYHVAGVVGVMMAYVMGVRDAPTLDRASDLGLAFQLTNISRDVIDDARAERVYVPQELLEEYGAPVKAAQVADRENWPGAHAATSELLSLAEIYYQSSKVGIKALPFRCAWAICAALKVYREIGEKVHHGGAEVWSSRVSASKGRKIWLALTAIFPAIRRKSVKPVSREGLFKRP